MFGYVTIYKDELKIREYNQFRAYYCGLCKTIGKQCSQVARMGLSYDMTFLSIVLSAVSKQNPIFNREICIAHPVHKHAMAEGNEVINYAAYMSVILVYLKLDDDWHDEHSIKALLGMATYFSANAKAKHLYKEEYTRIKELLGKLSKLEKDKSADIDAAADCFAKILEILFTPKFIEDLDARRTLAWLGYNTGRWIYIIDAVNDIEKDLKKKSYNPILEKYPIENQTIDEYRKTVSRDLEVTLTFTLDNIASSYELLNIKRNDEILRNILYLGLKMKQDSIIYTAKEEENESI